MRCHLKLTALKTGHNKKLIARRLAADLATEIHRAEAMLGYLPVDIIKAPEDKVKLVSADYERLGCIVTILKEEEAPQPKPQQQPSQSPTVVVPPTLVQTPISINDTKPSKSSSFNSVKESKIISLMKLDGVRLLLLVTILIGALFFITRCPTVKRSFYSN